KSNGDNQQTLELSARLPYLFKSPISLSANFNLFRQDSLFSNTSQSLSAEFQAAQNLSINTTYNHTSSNVTTSTPDSNPFTKNSLSLGLTYTNRKNYILLPQITQFKIDIGGARRIDQNATSQFFTTIEATKTFTISSKQQLYLKSNTRILSSEDYYENELFRFGGIKTLRGFKENSIFSSTYSTLQTELRQVLTNGLTVNSIFDLAYNKGHINNSENYLYSIGLGTSIVTQSGTLKLNFANGTTLGNTPKFSNTILHLTLLTQF
ncbi:MAG: BamA/TamA family outer membrane protein, partial [Bacteroidota bacterium]|nr:BamA/TamA family outer membrane protein [Bacteroidota bacterium]